MQGTASAFLGEIQAARQLMNDLVAEVHNLPDEASGGLSASDKNKAIKCLMGTSAGDIMSCLAFVQNPLVAQDAKLEYLRDLAAKSGAESQEEPGPRRLLSGGALRATASDTRSYENNSVKRRRLDLGTVPKNAPPFPKEHIGFVQAEENAVLLAMVKKLLSSLKGARMKTAAISGRDAVLYNGVVIVDTHDLRYLDGGAPDLTVVAEGFMVSPYTALAVLELQVGTLDNPRKGKMESYLASLLAANPDRHIAKGAVFNGAEFVLCMATRDQELYESLPRSMQAGAMDSWAHLWDFLLKGGKGNQEVNEQYGWSPPLLFLDDGDASTSRSRSPLQLKRYIASSGNVRVWEVDLPSNGTAVCKHYSGNERMPSFHRDFHAYLALKRAEAAGGDERRRVWPKLVGFSQQQHVLVSQPLARPAGLMTATTMRTLLRGCAYLHTVVKLVHRDLEPKHVGQAQDDGQPCIFDLSTCVALGGGSDVQGYAGTIVYASEDVLEALSVDGQIFVPARVQQDLVALVKTVYALIHTARLPRIEELVGEVAQDLAGAGEAAAGGVPVASGVAAKVRSFWQREFDSGSGAGRAWRELVLLAHVDTPGAAAGLWAPAGAAAAPQPLVGVWRRSWVSWYAPWRPDCAYLCALRLVQQHQQQRRGHCGYIRSVV